MKKRPILAVLLMLFVVALLVSGCDFFGKDPKPTPPNEDENLWQNIESPTPTDVYKQLLAGVMNVTTDFSLKNLESSPVLGTDAKLKLTMNDADLWLTLKGNYDHRNRENTMLCLEITTVEDSYDDVVIAVYLCKEVMYITLGDTKFKFNMPSERWENAFPFNMALDNSQMINRVSMLLHMVLAVKDDKINGKTRLNGLIEEYNYNFSLDLAGTLSKVQIHLINNQGDVDLISKINKIFANVLGLSVKHIEAGNVPESQLDIDFTISNNKLSAFSSNIHIDQSGEYANTLFKGEDINLDIELVKFSTSKSNISIDFVNSEEKQSKFIDYLRGDYSFKLALDVRKMLDGNNFKDYQMVLAAKIFQEDSNNNFLLLEFYDKNTSNLEKVLYFYDKHFYTFDTIANELVCTTKGEMDISELADSVYKNNFNGVESNGSFNLFDTISYVLGVLKMDTSGFLFNINKKLFEDIWFNYQPMLNYVNSLFEEDIFSSEYKLGEFLSFLTEDDTIANFVFEDKFLSMMEDSNQLIVNAIERMAQAEPPYTFTRKESQPE